MQTIAAIALFTTLAFGSFQLKTHELVGEFSFVALIFASIISGFIVHFNDRLKRVNFHNGLELYEKIKEKEASIKEVSKCIVDYADAQTNGALFALLPAQQKKAEDAIKRLRELTKS